MLMTDQKFVEFGCYGMYELDKEKVGEILLQHNIYLHDVADKLDRILTRVYKLGIARVSIDSDPRNQAILDILRSYHEEYWEVFASVEGSEYVIASNDREVWIN